MFFVGRYFYCLGFILKRRFISLIFNENQFYKLLNLTISLRYISCYIVTNSFSFSAISWDLFQELLRPSAYFSLSLTLFIW